MKTGAALALVAGGSLAWAAGANSMQSTTIDGLKIELNAPARVMDAQIRPGSAAHDSGAAAVNVVFSNESGQPIAAPLEEIGNGLVLVYRVAGREPLVDNAIPPPPHDGAVMTLAPGQAHVVRLNLDYPQPLLPQRVVDAVALQFCVRWQQEWLRTKNYRPGSVGWNKSFELCAPVQITPG